MSCADSPLARHLSAGVIAAAYPFAMVSAAVAAAGKQSERISKLQAESTAYCVIGLGLLMDVSTQEVIHAVTEGLRWAGSRGPTRFVGKSALANARLRLGSEPLRRLWEDAAKPMAQPGEPGCFIRGFRLVAIDGTTLEVPDTDANALHFGKAGAPNGGCSALPLLRLAAIQEVGTHAFLAVRFGPYAASELELADALVASLKVGMLCLADRYFLSTELWRKAAATGAHLAWRAKSNRILPVEEVLPDGSYLSSIYDCAEDRKRKRNPLTVRVVEYVVTTPRGRSSFRIVTTLLDPAEMSAEELAGTYSERWEIEGSFDELKTHLRGGRVVLRSKSPELVRQEVYGLLLAHRAVRELMHRAALACGEDPDRISFVHTVEVVRRKLAAKKPPFSPSGKGKVAETSGV
jgi:hypothetical protein